MIKRIIVAYDGSELAREAFAYAVMLAEAAKVEIFGMHALEPAPPVVMPADPVSGIDPNPILMQVAAADEAEQKAEREKAEKSLEELGEYCAKRSVPYSSVVAAGWLIEALVDLADPEDLIAVGMKGRFARAGIGSSTKALVRESPCPVVVATGPLHPVNRVLGVFDGSGGSKRAVAWSKDAARQTGWPLSVLAVSGRGLTLEESLEKAQAMAPDAQVIHYGPEGQSEAAQIEAAASHASMALLVMGAYPDTWLHQLFFGGGTTGQVLRKVNAPVALVH